MGPCRICGTERSPWGFRLPGPFTALKRRGYAWACDDHRADVAALQTRATRAAPPPPPDDRQGKLL